MNPPETHAKDPDLVRHCSNAGRPPAYTGRHRPSGRSFATPTLVRTGLLLPTSAMAAIVLTGSASPAQSAAQLALSSGEATAQAPSADASAQAAAALAGRGEQLRAARDDDRAQLAADRAQLAADRAQLAADRLTASISAKAAATARAREVALTRTPAGARGSHLWVNPFSNYHFSSPFGYRWGRLHAGIDLAGPVGTAVRAMSSGTVVFAGVEGGYGHKVEVRYWDGTVSWYGHLSSVEVKAGQAVNAGEVVARSGNTGHSTGPHLHLEIHPQGGKTAINPMPWLAGHAIKI